MAKIIQDSTLQDIADAIRSKDGTSSAIQVSNFAQKIENIPTGSSEFGSDYPIEDDNTHIWIKAESDLDLVYDFKFVSKANNNTLTVNWGDGSSSQYTGNSDTDITITHTYATKGNYRIDISSTGKFAIKTPNTDGRLQSISCITKTYIIQLGKNYNLSNTVRSTLYSFIKLKKIGFNVGSGNTLYFGYSAFPYCSSLEEINVISGKAYASTNQNTVYLNFYYCYNLRKFTGNFPIDKCAYVFSYCYSIEEIDYRNTTGTSMGGNRVQACINLKKLYLPDTITSLATNSFNGCTQDFLHIYVPWSEGDVANAPWGATNATIHYDWTEGGQ